ncbi:hypothetical protein [Pontibacter oryzae]|uniref:Secreted protein n=1 Tax=Pontibacter oryzae TaxID=2304593 RepID=A0A399S680_9BACT|nr:hypothetical protein [Pontibacter oryzae]RIJ37572.1 hypothetical protein D1627_10710 [Pontibacter oryzae]
MNKNVIAVFAAACGLFMASCGTPSDLRPDEKVSTETVAPGTRHTFNVSDAGNAEVTTHGTVQGHPDKEQVMPNHDEGGNTIQPGDSVREVSETNTEAGATHH